MQRMWWAGLLAALVVARAQAQPMMVAGKEPVRLDPRRTEMRQALREQPLPHAPEGVAERRLSEQERAELRQLLRLSAQRRTDDVRH